MREKTKGRKRKGEKREREEGEDKGKMESQKSVREG